MNTRAKMGILSSEHEGEVSSCCAWHPWGWRKRRCGGVNVCQRTYTKGLRAAYNEICTKGTIRDFKAERHENQGILLLSNIAIFAGAVSEYRAGI